MSTIVCACGAVEDQPCPYGQAACKRRTESPRELAAKIADGQAYVDQDAVTVAEAYLELLAMPAVRVLAEAPAWRGVYPMFCRDPEICRGRTSCPRNPSCSE